MPRSRTVGFELLKQESWVLILEGSNTLSSMEFADDDDGPMKTSSNCYSVADEGSRSSSCYSVVDEESKVLQFFG